MSNNKESDKEFDENKINQILEELELENNENNEHCNDETEKQEFDIENDENVINSEFDDALILDWPSVIIIAGSTCTGKSELMKNIVYKNYKNFNRIYLLCPNANNSFYNFINDKYKIKDPCDADLQTIYDDCCKNPNIKTLIILNDCIERVNFRNGAASEITTCGRYVNVSMIIVMQYLNKISPVIRDNAKYLFATKLKSHCVNTVFEITSCFNNKNTCKRFLDVACKNYQVVRFNLTGYNKKDYLVFKNKKARNFIIEQK